MRSQLLVLSALVACAPERPLPDAARGALLLATLRDDGALEALSAVDGVGARSLPLPAGKRARLLSYDEDAEALALVVGPDGAIAHFAVGVGEDAWPLPPPRAAYEIAPDGEITPAGLLTDFLATFRVKRPPCPPLGHVRRIPGLPSTTGYTFAVLVGGQILVGYDEVASGAHGAAVVRVDPVGTATRTLLSAPAGTLPPAPRAAALGDRAELVWYDPARREQVLMGMASDGELGPPEPIGLGALHRVELEQLALAGTTLLALAKASTVATAATELPQHLLALERAPLEWRSVFALTGPDQRCDVGNSSSVLLATGPGEALAMLRPGPLLAVDVGASGARVTDELLAGPYCRGQYTRLADATELLLLEPPSPLTPEAYLRRPGGEWRPIVIDPTAAISAQAIAPFRAGALVPNRDHSLSYLDHHPSRPELAPRACPTLAPLDARINTYFIVPIDDQSVFVAGIEDAPIFIDFD